ncbi:hypothetical protein [Thermus scotoductus]|uniref:Uncharacterized protein n=2 Tax=Thermus scotoductus TaxID=37636 RepID=A0A430UTD2_THESC|nr:hypothetical protein [Thermus scotoductus]RTI11855.1 hypothetical protein CSW27_11515 [Thermus scotoductus]
MPGSDEWRYDAFSGEWLTTGDVARRLGLSPGTVRHYAEVLRERGYPLRQGEEGEWLWPPEVVELVRVAYHAARCLSPRLSLEDMLDLLERTATYTLTRRGETLHDLVARVRQAVGNLSREREALEEAVEEIREAARGARAAMERAASGVQGELARTLAQVKEQVNTQLAGANWGYVLSGVALVVLAVGFVVQALGGGQEAGAVERILKVVPYLATALAGGVVGWWLRG